MGHRQEEIMSSRSAARLGVLLALGLLAVAPASRAQAPGPAAAPPASRSVVGTLEAVDESLNGVIMKTDEGQRVAWKFEPGVIERIRGFRPGVPVIVIYRQRGSDKAVTAVAFPGAAASPVYVNTSGQRVEIVGGPMVDGACGKASDAPLTSTTIPMGGQAEVPDACWCCAPAGETCTPANRTGAGQAFLANCYK
jgi:hypothetical protein